MTMPGILFIVSTPIGNLKDITLRAIETLKAVDIILCEDTRVTGRLLGHHGISNRMTTLTDFSEQEKAPQVISMLMEGKNAALVSDAGTPLVSDPGFKLIRECISKSIKIKAIPGPVAAIAALTTSGLPTDKFLFLGFLPKKDGKRIDLLKNVKNANASVKSTVIIYESPYRIVKTLNQVMEVFGDIDVVLAREITKLHEETIRAKISELLVAELALKGEYILLF